MATNTTDRQLVGIVLAIVAVLVVLPALMMGGGLFGTGSVMHGTVDHGMWGTADAAPGWAVFLGLAIRLIFLAVVVGGGYLLYRALTGMGDTTDPAIEELRTAYARGELSEEEFERRRERLDTNS